MKWLHLGLLASGLAGFAWLLATSDLATLWSQALRLGMTGTAAIVALGGLEQAFHALGWKACFPPGSAPRMRPLLAAQLAGNAVNLVTPTATVGGEFVRATLLSPDSPRRDALAALTVDRLTYAGSDAVIGLCGVAVLMRAPELDTATRIALVTGTGLVIVGIVIFSLLQRSGKLIALLSERRSLERVIGATLFAKLRDLGSEVDERIAALHSDSGRALLASALLHVIGSSMLLAQLACLVYFAGFSVTTASLLEIFVVVTALDLASFFVPGRVGAQEGARMLGVMLAGLPMELGLLFSLAQRLEQAVWTGVGFSIYTRVLSARGAAGESIS